MTIDTNIFFQNNFNMEKRATEVARSGLFSRKQLFTQVEQRATADKVTGTRHAGNNLCSLALSVTYLKLYLFHFPNTPTLFFQTGI